VSVTVSAPAGTAGVDEESGSVGGSRVDMIVQRACCHERHARSARRERSGAAEGLRGRP
jgi:hypothetical protein